MKFDSKAIALSFSAVVGGISIVCALLLLIAPDLAFALANYIAHGTDLAKISKTATIDGAIIGTIMIMIFSYIAAYVFAEIYNWIAKE